MINWLKDWLRIIRSAKSFSPAALIKWSHCRRKRHLINLLTASQFTPISDSLSVYCAPFTNRKISTGSCFQLSRALWALTSLPLQHSCGRKTGRAAFGRRHSQFLLWKCVSDHGREYKVRHILSTTGSDIIESYQAPCNTDKVESYIQQSDIGTRVMFSTNSIYIEQ